ncbi:MAG TPA: hypothetical protein VEM95_04930 [Thermoplasmata archaeon]|nr:hypothetical protein [Thermoplasmata archaeon]
MFGGHPGPWHAMKAWNGWWGVSPPFHHPAFEDFSPDLAVWVVFYGPSGGELPAKGKP